MNASSIEVVRDFGIPTDLCCFSEDMRQVFANLISNALDALQAGGVSGFEYGQLGPILMESGLR